MNNTQKQIRKAVVEAMVAASKKTKVDGKDIASIQAGTVVKITSAEITKIYGEVGEEVPKFPAYAAARWSGVWDPSFRATLAGADLRVTCVQAHDRGVADLTRLGAAAAVTVKIKREEVKVDKDYFAWPDETTELEKALLADKNIFLSGPTGCGKTQIFVRLCKKHGKEYERINMDGDISKSDFVGDWVLQSAEGAPEMKFVDGILPVCMEKGSKLIIDELDAAPQEVLFTLQAVLEGAPLVNTKTGKRIVAKAGFAVLATANTVGKGDMSTLYAGTRLLNEATLDRFHYILRMDYPKPAVEAKIMQQVTGCGNAWAKQIAKLAESVRKMAKDGAIFSTFSVRKSLNFASAVMDGVDGKFAFRATILDRMSEEDAVKISESAQRIINYGVHPQAN
jgi:cobaltochelatase CobS